MTVLSPLASRVIAVAVPVCAGVLAVACGASSPSAQPTTTVTVTTAPTSPAAPVTSAPPTTAPPGPAPCPTRSLGVKLGLSQGAAGSTYTVIDFTNISSVTCTLYGYPGVVFAGGTPVHPIGLPATENPATPRQLVTLAPGAVASALLRIVHAENFPVAQCHLASVTYLQVIPPNQTTPVYVQYTSSTCSSHVRILTVDAVRPGSGG